VVCNVLLLGRFEGRDRRRPVPGGGEELRPDDCVRWELHDSAEIVRVLWELAVSVRCVPDQHRLFTGAASSLCRYGLPTRRAG